MASPNPPPPPNTSSSNTSATRSNSTTSTTSTTPRQLRRLLPRLAPSYHNPNYPQLAPLPTYYPPQIIYQFASPDPGSVSRPVVSPIPEQPYHLSYQDSWVNTGFFRTDQFLPHGFLSFGTAYTGGEGATPGVFNQAPVSFSQIPKPQPQPQSQFPDAKKGKQKKVPRKVLKRLKEEREEGCTNLFANNEISSSCNKINPSSVATQIPIFQPTSSPSSQISSHNHGNWPRSWTGGYNNLEEGENKMEFASHPQANLRNRANTSSVFNFPSLPRTPYDQFQHSSTTDTSAISTSPSLLPSSQMEPPSNQHFPSFPEPQFPDALKLLRPLVIDSSDNTEDEVGRPSGSSFDNNGLKDLREKQRGSNLMNVRGRKVLIHDDDPSLYSMCRSWVRGGSYKGPQPQLQNSNVLKLPKPLPKEPEVVVLDSPDNIEEDEDNEKSVEHLSAKELLQRHIKRGKKLRAWKNEEARQKLKRYKNRLLILTEAMSKKKDQQPPDENKPG